MTLQIRIKGLGLGLKEHKELPCAQDLAFLLERNCLSDPLVYHQLVNSNLYIFLIHRVFAQLC